MNKFEKFQKINKDRYSSINDFLKKRCLLTTREWMVSELAKDFRRESDGTMPMTEIGKKLPEIFPFMEKEYSASEISNAKNSFEKKVMRAGVTFLYSIKKGAIKEEKIEEILTEIATNIKEIKEVLDEEPNKEILKQLPDELKDVIEKVNQIEKGDNFDLNSPLFGKFIEGELGKKWTEKIDSDKFGKIIIKLIFDRPLSKNDILAPENLKNGNPDST